MANESNKELTSVWTPANIVTCVRIVFIPVFMIVSALSHTSVAGTDWSIFDGPQYLLQTDNAASCFL